MAATKWNSLGLCAGVGMLDIAVQLGCEHFGIECRPAALCEWDAYAASVLLSRMEDATLEPCPIWCGDLRDFDAGPFRGVVDIIAAGLPCQPYSVAGKQLGNVDKRSHGEDGDGPIPQFLRIVAECRPAVVFLENVPPWVRGGWFRPVGEELSRLGYTIEDPLFINAESVGASHKRERVFVLAHDSRARNRWLPKSSQRNNATDAHWNGGTARADSQVRELRGQIQGMERIGQPMPVMPARKHTNEMAVAKRTRRKTAGSRRSLDAGSEFESGRGAVADSEREVLGGQSDAPQRRQDGRVAAYRHGEAVADTGGARQQERPGERRDAGEERAAVERDCVDIFAPGPNADWRGIEPHLWPAIEPGFRVFLDGNALVVDASRADQLRCAGNAVVPLCASLALIHLVRMSGILNGVVRGETKKARRV